MIQDFFNRKDRYSIVIDVTPEIASAWLTECNTHNRNIVNDHVDRLAREMKAGRWQLTHQGIAFSSNRVLLDGQHRLWAVLLSGVTVRMRVFFNEPPESLGAIDTIRTRTNDEIISLSGGMGTVTKRELAILRAMLAGLARYDRRTPGEEAEILARHREAVAFANEILPSARYRGVATAMTQGVLARAFYSADLGKLRHFADVLQSGVASGEDDQPITLLLKFLLDSGHGRKGRPEAREHYGKTERALSAYLNAEQLTKLYTVTTEIFPLPEEYQERSAA